MTVAERAEAETDGGAAPDKAGPRRMLNEKQVLEIVPIGRTTLYRVALDGSDPRELATPQGGSDPDWSGVAE